MTETRLHVVVVTFQIRPETTGPFEALLTRNASLSLDLEPSCIQFDICRSTQDPASFVLYELYESAEAFADHLQMPHFKEFDSAVASMLVGKSVQVFERVWPC